MVYDSRLGPDREKSARPMLRAAWAFLIFAVFGLGFRVCFPSQYSDTQLADYTNLSAAHAIRYLENDLGQVQKADYGLSTHPGLPYYAAIGRARYLSGVTHGEDAVERTVNFFQNIERFWNVQALAAALLAGLGAAFLCLYSRSAPLGFVLALAALPLAYVGRDYCSTYFYDLANETFTLPFIGLYLLLARRVFREESEKLIFIFGAAGALFYTLKMPYIIFFAAGFMAPLSWGLKSKSLRRIMALAAIYLAGFIALLAAAAALLGPEIVFSCLKFHASIITHTGDFGNGARGLFALEEIWRNLKYLFRSYHRAIWPAWLFLVVLALLLGRRKLKPRSWRLLLLMASVFIFNALICLKHWGNHYALVQPLILLFIIYELAEPLLNTGWGGRGGRLGLTLSAAILAVMCAYPGLRTFSERLSNLSSLRLEETEMLRQIEKLPLKDDEGIYFQWYSSLPFFYTADSLIFYASFAPDEFVNEVLNKLFPGKRRWLSRANYWRNCTDKSPLKIKYFVAGGSKFKKFPEEIPEGQAMSFDTPHPRLVFEPGDTVVLRSSRLAVIEKAAVIDLKDEGTVVKKGGNP